MSSLNWSKIRIERQMREASSLERQEKAKERARTRKFVPRPALKSIMLSCGCRVAWRPVTSDELKAMESDHVCPKCAAPGPRQP